MYFTFDRKKPNSARNVAPSQSETQKTKSNVRFIKVSSAKDSGKRKNFEIKEGRLGRFRKNESGNE